MRFINSSLLIILPQQTLCTDLLALRIDDSPDRQTLASLPPHHLNGSLDLAPQYHGFPKWQLLVVSDRKAEVLERYKCAYTVKYSQRQKPPPVISIITDMKVQYRVLTYICSSLHLLPTVGKPVVHLQRCHTLKLRQLTT